MAKGDVKSSGGYGGGGGGYSGHNDEGRGRSKELWEGFEEFYENHDFDCSWLFTLSDKYLTTYVQGTTWRYGVADGPRVWTGNYSADGRGGKWLDDRHAEDDSRMARIVKKHCGEDAWLKFSKHITEAWERRQAVLQDERDERERERKRGWEAGAKGRAAREAKELKLRVEETQEIRDEVEMTAGVLRSDFVDAFRYTEAHGLRDGDWLDDPVAAYATGYGFGEEVRERSGVKLQITVSLDMSNSMRYNSVDEDALNAFRTIYLTLEALQKEHSGDMFIAAFKFSMDDDGRGAAHVRNTTWYGVERELKDEYTWSMFSGEDTWTYPLFMEIEKWENAESDPGAIRLDIVITDAVLEHPKDVRESSKIQERRDGALQTVLLNLMPEDQWLDSTLPLRCVQYPANRDNLAGLLRNILAEFVSVYV